MSDDAMFMSLWLSGEEEKFEFDLFSEHDPQSILYQEPVDNAPIHQEAPAPLMPAPDIITLLVETMNRQTDELEALKMKLAQSETNQLLMWQLLNRKNNRKRPGSIVSPETGSRQTKISRSPMQTYDSVDMEYRNNIMGQTSLVNMFNKKQKI